MTEDDRILRMKQCTAQYYKCSLEFDLSVRVAIVGSALDVVILLEIGCSPTRRAITWNFHIHLVRASISIA
jgi:hypothetical protein